VLAASASIARAQSIEPRAYSNTPVGVNFLLAGPYYTRGGLSFDTSLPLTDPQLKTTNVVVGYARALDLWGKSGKFDVIVPYTWLSGSAFYRGDAVEREVDGFGDPAFRLSMNFYGAPALTLPEFQSYEQDLIVGASFQVSVPAGQYDSTKLVNIGTNRWYFKPELGASKALGPLTLEFKAGVTLFTTNTDFFNGNRRSQDPLYSIGSHAIYSFSSGIWASVDATYFAGALARSTERSRTTSSRTGAWAGPWPSPWTFATPSSSTRAVACRPGPATASTSSALCGSTGGAAGFDARGHSGIAYRPFRGASLTSCTTAIRPSRARWPWRAGCLLLAGVERLPELPRRNDPESADGRKF